MLAALEDLLAMIVTTLQETSDHDQYSAAVEKTSFDGRYSASSVILTLSVALALYNSLEMVLLIATTFRRWRGLYFWSLSICNLGVVLYTIGMMTTYFDLSVLWLSKVLNDAGWIGMVVCQSLVLYSRLGLILDSPNILRAVKWMILANSIVLVTTVVVLDFGTSYSASPSFAKGYFYIEHIQLIGFTIQETIISALYVWKAISLLEVISKANTRSMMWQLLIMNLVIIGMDVSGIAPFEFHYSYHFRLLLSSYNSGIFSSTRKASKLSCTASNSNSKFIYCPSWSTLSMVAPPTDQ
jgi:hypothetical protein